MRPLPEEERIPDVPGQLLFDGQEVQGEEGLLFRWGSPLEKRAQRSTVRLEFGKQKIRREAT